MPYNIIELPKKPDIREKKFILDTNIWLIVFKQVSSLDRVETLYYDYFYYLCKKGASDPLILLPSFVLSELIYRTMRDVYMKKYVNEKNEKDLLKSIGYATYYKEQYKKSAEYKTDYKILCADIMNFNMFFNIINDDFDSFVDKEKLNLIMEGTLDFTDFLIYNKAKINNFVIVTNDGDFAVEDVEIHTLNNDLLSLK